MKSILMITHSSNNTGGGENDFMTLLEHLRGKYYIYTIVPEGPKANQIKNLSHKTLIIPDKIFPFEGFHFKKYISYLYYSLKKLNLLFPFILQNRKNINVTFVNSSVCIIEIFVLSILNVPYILSIKEIIEPKFVRKLFYKLFNRTSKRIIVISETLKSLLKEVNINSNPILIRSSINEELYLLEKNNLSNSPRKLNKAFTIVNIGVINPNKNQKLLIDAIYELKPVSQIKVIFIGKIVDDKYYNYIKNVIKNYNFQNAQFIFTKDLPPKKVLEEMYYSDCVVITSLKEGMSLVLVESLFMEKPVIATSVGVIPEIIRNGYNGFIANNAKDLAEYIEKLKSDYNLVEYISSNTYKSYKENFSNIYYQMKHEDIFFGDS